MPSPAAATAPIVAPLTLGAFTTIDWAVLIVYFVLVLSLGSLTARFKRVRGSRDYFLAARSIPTWVVAISILSTAQSGATFIGGPSQSYAGDLTYLSSNIGQIIAAVILATLFIPVYYAAAVTTPYELLENRFGRPARFAAAVTYLIGRIFASGSRVFIGSLPMSLVIFGDIVPEHMTISIAIVSVIGTVYALAGGIRSVIWTDVLQVSVYMGSAIFAVFLLLSRIDAGVLDILSTLAKPGADGTSKLSLFRTGFTPGLGYDFKQEFTLPTALIGFTLLGLASYGMDQDLVQRMLTCKSARKGAWSVISGVLIGIPAVCVFMLIGLLLHVYYQRPDLTGAVHAPGGNEKIFLQFILDAAPTGVVGLMMAGLFAAGMAPLTSMSSAFVSDIYKHAKPNRPDRHYLAVGRAAVVAFGAILGLFATACIAWYDPEKNTLINFALGVMSFAYAGLLGVFFTAMFTKRGNSTSAIVSLISGFVVVTMLEPALWEAWTARVGLVDWSYATIAFPWRLTIGAAIAFIVCFAGKPRPTAGAPRS